MSARRGSSSSETASGESSGQEPVAGGDDAARHGLAREFVWGILAVSMHFEDIRYAWADILGISGPQWLILMAIHDLDRGGGVSVRDVARKLHVDRSFITTQTQSLEKQGFMSRTVSADDARIVLMSVTDKARNEIKALSARQQSLDAFIFSDLDDRALRDIVDKLKLLEGRLEKASLKLAAES